MRTKNQTKRLNAGSFLRKVGALIMGTALLASSNLTTAALANNQGERQAIFEQLRLDNPDAGKKELHQLFKQEWREIKGAGNGAGGGVESVIQNQAIQNINNAPNHLDRNDFASKAEWQAAKLQLKLDQKSMNDTINQTVQQTANKLINVNAGFALDLTSAVQSITLGDKLFKNQESVTINIGGQDKTLSAGSKVTAAEYVAAKQAMAGGAQTVTLDADGRATGGSVDLSAMTAGNKTMKVSDLTVPVAVTASGDFGKGGDVKITGDLTNNGSITAFSSGKNNVNALIKADNITNNAGASIDSQVANLTLQADNNLSNYGDISASGNLTLNAGNSLTNSGSVNVAKNLNVFSPNVTNTGNIASANGNITFDTPVPTALNITNTNGTVSALNGAINIREAGYNAAFDSVVNGGDFLSKDFNMNAGGGTIYVDARNITGNVQGSGYGSHVQVSDTEVLNLGSLSFIDPTYYNAGGSININGDITVNEGLAILARNSITQTGTRTITTNGNEVNLYAGFTVTPTGGTSSGSAPNGTPATGNTTITPAGLLAGGNITLNAMTINTTGAANGGAVNIVARDGSVGGGAVNLSGSSIVTGGVGGGTNGNVLISGGNGVNTGAITTTGGTGGGGTVNINTNNTTGGSATFNSLGTTTANTLSTSATNTNVTITGAISAAGAVTVTAGGTTTINGAVTANTGGLTVNGGDAITLNSAVNTTSGNVNLNTPGGNSDITVSGTGSVTTTTGTITLTANDDVTVNGALSSGSGGLVTVQNTGTGGTNTITLGANVSSTGGNVVYNSDDDVLYTAGVTSGNNLTVTAGTNVGTGANRISTNVTNLTTTAGTSAFYTEANGVNVQASSAGTQFNLVTTGAGLVNLQGAVATPILSVNANTSITVSTAQNNSTSVSLTTNNAGAMNINAALTGGTVTLTGNGTSTIDTNNAGTISGSTITLQTNAGTGAITTNGAISGTGVLTMNAGGALDVNAAVQGSSVALTSAGAMTLDNNVTANTTSISATASSGGLSVAAGVAISAGTTVGLTANGGGALITGLTSSVGGTNVTLTTNGGGTLTSNSSITASGALVANSSGIMAINGTTQGNSVALTANGAAMNLNGNITSATTFTANNTGGVIHNTATSIAGTSATWTASGNITSNGGLLQAPTVSLTSTGGSIGTGTATRFNLDADNASFSATAGNIYVNDNNALNVTGATANAATGTVDILTAGAFTNSGAISGNDVVIRSSGSTATLNAAVTATNSINVRAFGNVTNNVPLSATTITETSDFGSLIINSAITGTTVNLTSFNSITNATLGGFVTAISNLNLVSTVGSIGSVGDQLLVLAPNLSAKANAGSVYIIDAATGNVTLNANNSSAAGTFSLTRTDAGVGDIIVAGTLGASNVILQNVAGNGGVQVNNVISANGGGNATSVSLIANGAGAISTTGAAILTNALNLQSTSGNIGSGTPIFTNANSITFNTTGDVSIADNRTGSVTLNASTANNATVALITNNTNLVVAGDVFASGLLALQTAAGGSGNISRSGTATLNASALNMAAGGNIGSLATPLLTNTNSLTASAGVGRSIFISEQDSVIINLVSAGATVNVSAGGDMAILGPVNGTTAVLNTTSGGNILGIGGVVNANTVQLSSDFGNIGSGANAVALNAANVSANTGGNVLIVDSAASVNLQSSSANVFDFTRTSASNGTVTVQGPLAANTVSLTTNGGGAGSIAVNAPIGGQFGGNSSAVTLSAAIGAISTTGAPISTNTLTLLATGAIGTSGNNIVTNAGTFSANTAGDVFVNDTNAGTTTVNASSGANMNITTAGATNLAGAMTATSSFNLLSGGTATVNGAVSGPTTNITTQNNGNIVLNNTITAATVTNLTAGGSGNITRTGGTINTASLNLVSTSGNIGATGAANNIQTNATALTANTSGNVFVTDTAGAGVNLGASSANNFNLSANNILNVVGALSATGSANLTAGGDINVTAAVNAASANINSTGDDIDITAAINTTGAANFTVAGANTITNSGAGTINAGTNIAWTSGTGALTANAAMNAGGSLSLTTAGAGTITSNAAGTLTATNVTTTSAAGATTLAGAINASNNAAFNATSGAITTNALTANNVAYTTTSGNININGATNVTNNLTSTTQNGDLTQNGAVNAGGAVNYTATVDTGDVTINNTLTAGTSATVTVTGANSQIDVNGNINAGTTATLTASGDPINVNAQVNGANVIVQNNGGIIDINGSLNATNNVTVSNQGGSTITLDGTINAGNNVSMSNTNAAINLNGATTAGNLVTLSVTSGNVVGNAGGLVTADTVAMTGTSGALTVFANANNISATTATGTGAADINITSRKAGFVNLTNLVGNDITVSGTGAGTTLNFGTVNAGNTLNLSTAATTNGNINFSNNVTFGGATANVTANGVGNITRTAGVITGTAGGNTLNLTSGSGDIGGVGDPIFTSVANLSANTTGNVYINEANALGLNASTGNTFNLTTGGALTVNGVVGATNLAMTSAGAQTLNAVVNASTANLTATGGAFNLNAQMNAGTVAIQGVGIVINDDIEGIGGGVRANSVTLTSTGAGTITRPGANDVILTNALTLNAATGDIGLTGQRILANANTINGSTTANFFVTNQNTAAWTLGAVSGNNVGVNNSTNNVGMIIGGPVTGSTSINLATLGTGAITRTGATSVLTAPSVTLTGGSIGTSGSRVLTAADNLTAIATAGNVFIAETDNVTLGGTSSASGQFNLTAGGNLTVNNLNGGTSVTLATTNGGAITSSVGTSISTPNLTTNSDSGTIFVNTNAGQVAGNTAGNLSIQSTNTSVTVGQANGANVLLVSGGNLFLGQNVNAVGGGVQLVANGTGNISQQAGTSINTSTLNMGASGGTTGTIATSASNIFGNSFGGDFNVTSSFAGPVLLTGITATGNVNVGTTGSNSNIVVSNAISAGNNVNLIAGPGTNGGIVVNANVNGGLATGVVNLTADGTGNITNPAGVITANGVNLTSTFGSIGTFAKYVTINAANMTANTSGNVYVNNTRVGGIALGTSSGSNFNVHFSSNLTVGGGGIFGNIVNLTANGGTNAGVILNNTSGSSSITGTTSITINADGTGTISQVPGLSSLLNTPTVVLTSGSGDIGSLSNPIFINATNVTATTTGGIYLNNINTGTVNLGPATGTDFFYQNNGTINVVGVLDFSNNVTLITTNNGSINVNAGIIADNTLTLTAGGIGNITQASGTLLDTSNLIATSGGGNIGSLANPLTTNAPSMTVNTGGLGSAWVNNINAGLVTLNGQNGAGQTFNLTVAGSVTTALGAGNYVQANTANITAVNGNIGNGVLNPLVTNVGNFSGTAINGNVTVLDQDSMNVTGITAGGDVVVAATNNLSTSGAIVGGDEVVLAALNGALDINAAVTAVSQIGLLSGASLNTADLGTAGINAATIAFVSLNGNINLNLDNTNVPSLQNAAFDADQGSVNVTSTKGTDLHLVDVTFASLAPLGPNLSVATNQSNGYTVNSNGSLFVDNTVDSGSGSLGLNTSNGGNITISAGASTNSGAQTNIFASGNVTTGAGSTITSVTDINLNGAGVTHNGSATSNTAGVFVQANTGNVTTGVGSSIQAATTAQLFSNVGTVTHNGSLSGDNSAVISGDAGVTTAVGSTVTSSAGSVSISSDNGAITLDGTATANTTADVIGLGLVTVTGNVSGTTTTIQSIGDSLMISGNITGSTAINLNSANDLLNANIAGGTFTSPQLNLTSVLGSVGASGDALDLNATVNVNDNLSMTANAGVDVYVTYDGASLTIGGGKSSASGTFDVINTVGSLTVTGGIDPAVVNLTSNTFLAINSLVTASVQVNLSAVDDITTNASGLIQAPLMVANSSAGAVGTGLATPLNTDVDNIDVTAATDAFIYNATKSMNINFGSAGNTFVAVAEGNLTSTGTISGDVVGLAALGTGGKLTLGAAVTATSQIGLVADGNIENGDFTMLDAPSLTLASVSGSVGTTGNALVLNATNTANLANASFDADGEVNVAADVSNLTLQDNTFLGVLTATNNANNGNYVVSNTGNIQVNASGVEADGAVNLQSSAGSINVDAAISALTNVTVFAAVDVTTTANGTVDGNVISIQGNNSVTLNAAVTSAGLGNSVTVTSDGTVQSNVGAVISGNTITLTSNTGAVVINEDVTGTGVGSVLTITASGTSPNGSVTTNVGADITGHTITVTSTNDSLVLNGTIDSTGAVGNSVSLSAFNNITAANVANVSAESLSLTSTNGSVGTDFSGGEILVGGITNLTVNAAVDSFIRINGDINLVGTNVVDGNFSFGGGSTGGSIDVTGTVNAGQFNTSLGGTNGGDLTISSTGSVTAGAMNLFTFSGTGADGDVTVSGVLKSTTGITFNAFGDITTTGAAFIEADSISFNAANINVTTKANGASVIATGATGATIVNVGNFELQSATVTNTLDVSTDATIGGDITVSGLSTANVLNLTANTGTLPANGDIILNASITGTTSVTLTADGGIQDNTNTIGGASVTLNASGGNIVANLSNGAAAQSVTINAGTFDSTINYTGTNTLTMLASNGDELTVTTTGTGLGAGASFAIGGDSTFNGDIDITTNNMTNAANVLTSTTGDIDIQSFSGSGLTLNGGVDPVGGSYSAGGAINVRATVNNLVLNGTTTYLTSANLFGNGAGQFVVNNGNQIAKAPSFVFTANLSGVGTYTNDPGPWNFVNSGTYANSDPSGDINIFGSLTFSGSNLAFIAAGDINFITPGATIDLSGTTGGNLTMIAGYDFTPPTGGQVFNNTGTIYQNFANTGSGDITGSVNILATGTSGNGGNVVAVANNGTISIGSIDTSSSGAAGGSVLLIGSQGVNVGNITSTGATAGGDVTLAVANANIPTGTGFQVQNGTVITGSVTVGSITTGDLIAGNISTGDAAVTVYGGNIAGNQVDLSNGVVADSLSLNMVNGVATVSSTVNTLDSTSTGTSAVTLSNSQALTLGTVTGANQSMNLTVTGAFDSSSAFTVNGFTVSADSIDLSSGAGTSTNGASLTSTAGDITGQFNTGSTSLTLDATGTIGVNPGGRFTTDATVMTVDATESAFINNTSATGVAFNSGTIANTFDLLSANTVTTVAANAITATDVVVNVTAGDLGATGAGNQFRVTNGSNPMNLTVTLSSTGNAFVDYQGSNALTLGGSTGGSLQLTTSNSTGSVVTGADSTFENDITITTNAMTNANTITSNNGDIIVQSNVGSGLTLTGAPGPLPNTGTFTATNGKISIIATANDLVLDGIMTYTTEASLIASGTGQSVITNVGSNSIALVNSYILTSNLVNNGTLTTLGGTWNVVNSATYANNTGNLTVSGTFNLAGADLAFVSSGDVDLSGATFNLSDVNGGNLTLMAGFDFNPPGTDVQNDITTTLTNFVANGTGGDITAGAINLNGTSGAAGNLIALANLGSVTLSSVTATGTTTGGNMTVIASDGITTGTINVSGSTGGNVNLISGNPTVGASFTILAGSITAGANTITSTGLTDGAISVGNVNAGNGSFSAQTGSGGSITAAAAVSAHDITLETGTLTLSTVSNLTSNVDGAGDAGSINVTASVVDTAAVGDRLTFVANGTNNGGNINFTLNNAAAVTLGISGTYEFQASGGTGNGGSSTFNTLGDVTLTTDSFIGTGALNGGEAHVTTDGNVNVSINNVFNLVGLDGKGAVIELNAGDDGTGTLVLGSNVGFFSQANGTGLNGDGGGLILTGSNVTFTGVGTSANPLELTAKGVGNGSGGEIIFKTDSTTQAFVGVPAKAPKGAGLFITADASAGAGGTGDGGNLVIEVGGNLTINDMTQATAARGSGGADGASYAFKAGQAANGNLIINGSIDSSANGGNAGTVNLSSRSAQAFSVNKSKPKNGVVGTINASGNNGEINITNQNGGILIQNTAALTSPEMNFTMAGAKGSFTVGTGTIINASALLTFTAAGGSIGGKGGLLVNTSTLQANTSGTGVVSIVNQNAGGTLVLDSSAGGNFSLTTNGSTTLNDITTTKGNITIVENGGALNVSNGSTITANNGALILQNTSNAGTIAIGDNATVQTLGTKGKSVSIVVGPTVPKTGTNAQAAGTANNIQVIIDNTKNFVWFGPNAPVAANALATVRSKNQNVLFQSATAGAITLGSGSLVFADPPTQASAPSAAPSVAAAVPADNKSTSLSQIFGFASEQSTMTSDLSVLSLNAAPQMQAANNATLMTATNTATLAAQAGLPVSNGLVNTGAINTGVSGLASVVRTTSVDTAEEDNSYVVGFCSTTGETQAAICTDAEIGMNAGMQGVQTVQHGERVVIKKGNVLFVPFKATTVETPNGIVHIDAKSVALVSSTDAGLAVYDLEDQHKGSVSVESNGHNVVLAPGRHVMITKHHTAEFAQINAVETIAHRNVQSVVKNGHRAHTSEFSVLTAMDTVKPLKALASSKHAHARQIADRMMKTTAIILQLGGGSGGQYQHYFKPRMTAMQK